MEVITHSEKETFDFAFDFASKIEGNRVICLNGELGAGKTVFVKGFCKFFDIDEISSPTFTLVNEYNGRNPVFHFDVYRLSDEDEFYAIGGDEYFERGICIIEWSDVIKDALPNNVIDVRIERIDDKTRKFIIT